MKRKFSQKNRALWIVLLLSCITAFAQTPYNIVMNITKNPTSEMAFNWFTAGENSGGGKVEIKLGSTTIATIAATSTQYTSATIYRALVTNLQANTIYTFRVGGVNNIWSSWGTFTTAKAEKEPFSFIYVADSHARIFLESYYNSQAADAKNPNTKFWLHGGDMAPGDETPPIDTMPERWKTFFSTQSHLFMKKPLAPVTGNHDVPYNNNIFNLHFNVQNVPFDATGSTYSFIYGDALFFAVNSENADATYINNLKEYMRNEINAHPNITWRIMYRHQPIYSPGYTHSTMALLCDELNINLVLQGHTHVYSVMGPLKNKNVVLNAVKYVNSTPANNSNGKSGGLFNVQEGTLYFTNGPFGMKFFPQKFAEISDERITGRWATALKMGNGSDAFVFSNVNVSTENIIITTYKTNNGISELFEEIKLVKQCIPSPSAPNSTINGTTTWNIAGNKTNNFTISSGAILTVTATVQALDCSIITIQNGGKLIVNGGTLDGFTVIAESGSTCTIQNNGKILLKEFDDFDIQLGALFDLTTGEVSLK